MQVESKLWLEKDGKHIFGKGMADILRTIEEVGSLNQAAQILGMPYRRVWDLVQAVEDHLGHPLLLRSRGGRGGGGTSLTDLGRYLLHQFDRIDSQVSKYAQERFDAEFKDVSRHLRKKGPARSP